MIGHCFWMIATPSPQKPSSDILSIWVSTPSPQEP